MSNYLLLLRASHLKREAVIVAGHEGHFIVTAAAAYLIFLVALLDLFILRVLDFILFCDGMTFIITGLCITFGGPRQLFFAVRMLSGAGRRATLFLAQFVIELGNATCFAIERQNLLFRFLLFLLYNFMRSLEALKQLKLLISRTIIVLVVYLSEKCQSCFFDTWRGGGGHAEQLLLVIRELPRYSFFGGKNGATSILITGNALPSAVWRDLLQQVLVEAVLDLLDGSVCQSAGYS